MSIPPPRSPSCQFSITTSTRRFFALPAGLSVPSGLVFGATGCRLPKPLAVICWGFTPAPSSALAAVSARRSESCWLKASLPIESVCPSTDTCLPVAWVLSTSAMLRTFSTALLVRSALPNANNTSGKLTTTPRSVSRASRLFRLSSSRSWRLCASCCGVKEPSQGETCHTCPAYRLVLKMRTRPRKNSQE